NWVPSCRVEILSHGVPPEFFAPARATRPVRTMLFVGQWLPMKGITYLRDAAVTLLREDLSLRLVCAGTLAAEESVLSDFPPELHARVVVMPRVEQRALAGLYREADAFVFPSLYEGFSRAIVEAMAARLAIVSAERVRDELVKLVCSPRPRAGLSLLVDTGLADQVLPELPTLRLEVDEHHRHKDVYEHTLIVLEQAIELEVPGTAPDFVLRFAALMHDVGKPRTRRFEAGGGVSFHHHEVVGAKMTATRMRALRFPKDVTEDVARLVELHLRFHGYAEGDWTDSAVRRYVNDAGPLLDRLHKLTRSDCTTRNRRKAQALSRAYDHLEERIAALREQEELDAIRPDLDGNAIMQVLGIPPGPLVGEAWRHLRELRLDRGPMSHDEAVAELHRWWATHQPP
ncbi:MAG: CCA tRNA nucleotidyltransferase, partial [Nocardioidaceae bacterium]